MKTFLLFLCVTLSLSIFSQKDPQPANNYQKEFANAYNQYPDVPKGLLEAVSFTMTRFQHLQNTTESCVGLPKTYGVMGLTLDGQNYFRNNLNYISQVSGIAVNDIINSPQQNITAYAASYQHELTLLSPFYYKSQNFAHILTQLSELPNNELQQDFALNSHLYGVLSFLDDTEMQKAYNFPNHNLDLENVFGKENLSILKSSNVSITKEEILNEQGESYKQSNNKSADYPPALSNITSCNFSSRGTAITAVTIHTIQGSYAGAISWANNCSSNVSYHYVLRSSDGQVTQVVLENDKAWHVGSENPYTIGLEHEGYINDSSWYTAAMYQSSAALITDITQSGYGIDPLRTAYFPWSSTTNYNVSSIPGSCIKIKGHQHYPSQSHTDPGANWDWDYYYKLINDPTSTTIVNTNQSGTVTDLGGAGNYTDDERTLFLIQPTNATAITLTVNQFDTEPTWDYLYIYEGTTVFSPLIGRFDGTSIPPTINVNSGAVLIEFRSDCATTNPGYDISWNASINTNLNELNASIVSYYPNPVKGNVTIEFNEHQTGTLLIRDVAGKTVAKQQVNNSLQQSVSLQGLAQGMYFLEFNNQLIKLIKE
jgi:N-acetyl-anhydromuramyl-L-alanine amidase AmpD